MPYPRLAVACTIMLLMCCSYTSDAVFSNSIGNPVKESSQELEGIGALDLVHLLHDMFRGKAAAKPRFLVVFGPPGSGKTRSIHKVMKHHHSPLSTYAEIVVDRMLRKITPYRTALLELLALRNCSSAEVDANVQLDATAASTSNSTGQGCLDEGAYLAESQKIYAEYRPAIKLVSRMVRDMAFGMGINVLWETTGSDLPKVMEEIQHARTADYEVWLVYPYVTHRTLIDRVRQRNTKIARTIPEALVLSMADVAPSNFAQLLPLVDVAYVYDNEGAIDAPLSEIFSKTAPVHQPAARTHTHSVGESGYELEEKESILDDSEHRRRTDVVLDQSGARIYCPRETLRQYPMLWEVLEHICQPDSHEESIET